MTKIRRFLEDDEASNAEPDAPAADNQTDAAQLPLWTDSPTNAPIEIFAQTIHGDSSSSCYQVTVCENNATLVEQDLNVVRVRFLTSAAGK